MSTHSRLYSSDQINIGSEASKRLFCDASESCDDRSEEDIEKE